MGSSENRAVALLREQVRSAWETMEGTARDVSPDTAQWLPPGTALPIGAAFAHAIMSQDAVLNGMVRKARPLFAAAFAGKTGVSEPHPGTDGNDPGLADPEAWGRVFAEWCRRVEIDLSLLRAYGEAVFADTDAWLATLSDSDLDASVDLTPMGMGPSSVAYVLSSVVIGHAYCHTGEIAALKGVRGLKGYPF